jgi:hypothetical protein
MSWVAKLGLFVGGFFALAALAWMLFLPKLVEHELRAVTGFDFHVAVLSANPFTGRVVVRELVALNPPRYPKPDFIQLQELRADIRVFSWAFGDRIIIDELDLNATKIELIRQKDGSSNAGDFMAAFTRGKPAAGGTAPPGRPARYRINRLRVRLEKLVVVDYQGSKTDEKVYDLRIDHSYNNVSDPRDLLVPEVMKTLYAFGLHHDIAQLLPGEFGQALAGAVGTAAHVTSKLKDVVKGTLDKLEHSGKP